MSTVPVSNSLMVTSAHKMVVFTTSIMFNAFMSILACTVSIMMFLMFSSRVLAECVVLGFMTGVIVTGLLYWASMSVLARVGAVVPDELAFVVDMAAGSSDADRAIIDEVTQIAQLKFFANRAAHRVFREYKVDYNPTSVFADADAHRAVKVLDASADPRWVGLRETDRLLRARTAAVLDNANDMVSV